MISYFPEAPIFDETCYVADYTNSTDNKRGVEISTIEFSDITFFTLKKVGKGNMPYQAINLELYPSFIKGINNCECVFNSLSENGRPWLLFLETKYCHKPENIDHHSQKAYHQMNETLLRLKGMGLVEESKRRIYFVYSVPPFTENEPFASFAVSQNEMLKCLEEKGILLMGYNSMLISTPQYLFAPKKKI